MLLLHFDVAPVSVSRHKLRMVEREMDPAKILSFELFVEAFIRLAVAACKPGEPVVGTLTHLMQRISSSNNLAEIEKFCGSKIRRGNRAEQKRPQIPEALFSRLQYDHSQQLRQSTQIPRYAQNEVRSHHPAQMLRSSAQFQVEEVALPRPVISIVQQLQGSHGDLLTALFRYYSNGAGRLQQDALEDLLQHAGLITALGLSAWDIDTILMQVLGSARSLESALTYKQFVGAMAMVSINSHHQRDITPGVQQSEPGAMVAFNLVPLMHHIEVLAEVLANEAALEAQAIQGTMKAPIQHQLR